MTIGGGQTDAGGQYGAILPTAGVIAAYGEPLLRISSSPDTPFVRTQSAAIAVGGAEWNVGMALASLGRPARLLGAVPQSFLGDMVTRAAAASGADVDHVSRVDGGRLGVYYVDKAVSPRRHRVVYDRSGSAFTTTDVPAGALDGVGLLVVSGITAALGDEPRARLEALVHAARDRGARVAVDVNHRALLWDAATAGTALRALLGAADIVICASRDAESLFGAQGTPLARASQLRSDVAPESALVVVTDGDRGAVAVSADGDWSVDAVPTQVVDRFGAGDGFTAGLLWALAEGRAVDAALAAGAALAAMVCTIDGDSACFTASDLQTVIADPNGVMVR
jgi:2-dehydro-3-deoxygluconokinase